MAMAKRNRKSAGNKPAVGDYNDWRKRNNGVLTIYGKANKEIWRSNG